MAEDSVLGAPSVTGAAAYAAADRRVEDPRKRKPKHPDDFDSEQEFLHYVRQEYREDLESERANRDEAILDQKFLAGEQWEPAVRQKRERAGKPTLTINRLPAFVAQLVGNRRLSETGIKIIPDNGGDRKVAEVREGLVRSIQKFSQAQYAFDKAFEQQVVSGLGNFQVHLDYAYDDAFEQDIKIAAIPNPLAVLWDRNSFHPTGSDARHVFVIDTLPRREFKRRYPDAEGGEWEADLTLNSEGLEEADTVQIASYWRMRTRKRTLALFTDGSVHDVTDLEGVEWFDLVARNDAGIPIVRDVQRPYAQMYLCSASSILEGPYELPISRVPVFRVPAWELFVEGRRHRWGLVRFLRDPMRLHNYWRSTIAEKLVGSPKAKWVAADTAVEGREKQWRESHISDDPLLIFNAASGQAPARVAAAELEQALIEQAGVAVQDIRDVANIHEASLGIQSNEVSGAAITARQRVGELGSVIYHDNLNMAIEECGKVINELIPFVYDTPRTVKVLGPDMLSEQEVPINGGRPDSVDITTGKYRVTITTGPSYTTRRVEAREEMMAMVNAMPNTMAIAADQIVENQDWPGADRIARRLRLQLPPGVLSPDEMDEQQIAQQQAAQQQQQQQQQMAEAAAQLEFQAKQFENAKLEADVQLRLAQVREALARAEEAEARAQQARTAAVKNVADVEKGEVDSAVKAVTALSNTAERAQSNAG